MSYIAPPRPPPIPPARTCRVTPNTTAQAGPGLPEGYRYSLTHSLTTAQPAAVASGPPLPLPSPAAVTAEASPAPSSPSAASCAASSPRCPASSAHSDTSRRNSAGAGMYPALPSPLVDPDPPDNPPARAAAEPRRAAARCSSVARVSYEISAAHFSTRRRAAPSSPSSPDAASPRCENEPRS